MDKYKVCSTCRQPLPATPEYFKRHKACSDGLNPRCKACESRIRKEKYRADLDVEREKGRARYARNRETVLARLRDRMHNDLEYREHRLEKKRESYHRNGDRNRQRKRAYCAVHREQEAARSKRWYWENRDRARAYGKAHPEYTRRWQERNRDHCSRYAAEYRKADPARHRLQARVQIIRRRARLKSALITLTPVDWQRCLEYFNHRCAVCGREVGLFHKIAADHWIPLAQGGPTTPDNIVPLCHGHGGCNNSKHDKLPDVWLRERFGAKKAKAILKSVGTYFETVRMREKGGSEHFSGDQDTRRAAAGEDRL